MKEVQRLENEKRFEKMRFLPSVSIRLMEVTRRIPHDTTGLIVQKNACKSYNSSRKRHASISTPSHSMTTGAYYVKAWKVPLAQKS